MSSIRASWAVVFVACAAVACGGRSSPAERATQASAQPAAASAPAPEAASPSTDDAGADLPPLPITPFPAARPMPIVRAVYTFAARHPDVLRTVPCFCGCESRGHRNNDDCFVAARDASGRVTAWEPHGVG